MTLISRRTFIELAAATGATAVWGVPEARAGVQWRERRDLFPEGVASGDPDQHSVLLWTRCPNRDRPRVDIAADDQFQHLIASAEAPLRQTDAPCGLPSSVVKMRISVLRMRTAA